MILFDIRAFQESLFILANLWWKLILPPPLTLWSIEMLNARILISSTQIIFTFIIAAFFKDGCFEVRQN